MSRRNELIKGNKVLNDVYKITPSDITAMYVCTQYDDEDTILDKLNVCSVCLALTDAPYNFGEEIEPTLYDADCDECNQDSLVYCD